MFEAYKIGVTLALRDEVTLKLLELSKSFAKIDLQVASISRNMNLIGREALGIGAIARESSRAAVAMERAAIASGNLQRNIRGLNATASHGGGGMHGGSLHIGRGGIGVGAIGFGLNPMVGGALLAGGAAAYGAHAAYDSAKQYETKQARFALLGMSAAQNAEAKRYVESMKGGNVSRIEGMQLFTEAQGVFRESGLDGDHALYGAKLATPLLAQIAFANKSLDPENAARMKTSSMAMLRFLEMRGGLSSPEKFNQIANQGYKAIQSSQGNIDWEQLRQFAARSGTSGQLLSDEALFGKLEPIIGELKGSTAGTALMTAYNRLTGVVKLPNQVLHSLVDRGIYDKDSVQFNKNGTLKSMKGNALGREKTDLLATDPVAFYQKYVAPSQVGMTEAEIGRDNALIFGRTGGNMFNLINRQKDVIANSVTAYRQANDIGQGAKLAGGTAEGKETQFENAWSDLKVTIGKDLLPRITKFIEGLTDFLRKVDDNWESIQKIFSVANTGYSVLSNPLGFAADKALSFFKGDSKGAINPIADGGSKPVQVTTTVNLDNEKIGRIVSSHMSKQASKPTASSTLFDPNQNFFQPNMPYMK